MQYAADAAGILRIYSVCAVMFLAGSESYMGSRTATVGSLRYVKSVSYAWRFLARACNWHHAADINVCKTFRTPSSMYIGTTRIAEEEGWRRRRDYETLALQPRSSWKVYSFTLYRWCTVVSGQWYIEDIFNRGSSYFNVARTSVLHMFCRMANH